jgi:hypothetical protein
LFLISRRNCSFTIIRKRMTNEERYMSGKEGRTRVREEEGWGKKKV